MEAACLGARVRNGGPWGSLVHGEGGGLGDAVLAFPGRAPVYVLA